MISGLILAATDGVKHPGNILKVFEKVLEDYKSYVPTFRGRSSV